VFFKSKHKSKQNPNGQGHSMDMGFHQQEPT
jgi:hypothetical protein